MQDVEPAAVQEEYAEDFEEYSEEHSKAAVLIQKRARGAAARKGKGEPPL